MKKRAAPDIGSDLWGRGARKWLRLLYAYVRSGRRKRSPTHLVLRRRFAAHWKLLEADTWRPMLIRANELGGWRWGRGMLDWRCGFLAIVAEVAYWWAWDIEQQPGRSLALRDAVAELRDIDQALVRLAGSMVEAIERRSELTEGYGLVSDWDGPGLDVWDILEAVAESPQFRGTCGDPSAGLSVFLRYMRGTSRRTPGLVDLLRQVSESNPGDPYAIDEADAEALRKGKGSQADAWPERVRTVFATLDGAACSWHGENGRRFSFLDCASPTSLAALLSVAAGFDPHDGQPGSLGAESLGRHLRRFRQETATDC